MPMLAYTYIPKCLMLCVFVDVSGQDINHLNFTNNVYGNLKLTIRIVLIVDRATN